jgi:hypothetical protein
MRLGEVARLIGLRPSYCWRKQQWKSEGAAKAHLRALLRSPGGRDKDRLVVYQCGVCQWYHVGHEPGGSDGR